MGISHIAPDKIYSAQYAWSLIQEDFFGWGFKKFMNALKNGHMGILIPWSKGEAANCAYRIKGADLIQFRDAIVAQAIMPNN